jgi:hypothetical protein
MVKKRLFSVLLAISVLSLLLAAGGMTVNAQNQQGTSTDEQYSSLILKLIGQIVALRLP